MSYARGKRIGAGRPKGSRNKKAEDVFVRQVAVKLLKEVAPEADPNGEEQSTLEWFWRSVLREAKSDKARDLANRSIQNMAAYAFGKPSETIEPKERAGNGKRNALVIPDKEPLDKWMKRHNQEKVEDKPN